MPRVRIRSDAPLFSREDYSYIMQCRDIKPRYKILNDLMSKYKTVASKSLKFFVTMERHGNNENVKRLCGEQRFCIYFVIM